MSKLSPLPLSIPPSYNSICLDGTLQPLRHERLKLSSEVKIRNYLLAETKDLLSALQHDVESDEILTDDDNGIVSQNQSECCEK